MATRKDCVRTAEALQELYRENMNEWGKVYPVNFTDVVLKLATMYEQDNPQFDRIKFLYACTPETA
tara:strand:- start:467 stop:664 length:198 start_codon:yes stop_codon:yes gene_type:complete